jgi:hypothetical protein
MIRSSGICKFAESIGAGYSLMNLDMLAWRDEVYVLMRQGENRGKKLCAVTKPRI